MPARPAAANRQAGWQVRDSTTHATQYEYVKGSLATASLSRHGHQCHGHSHHAMMVLEQLHTALNFNAWPAHSHTSEVPPVTATPYETATTPLKPSCKPCTVRCSTCPGSLALSVGRAGLHHMTPLAVVLQNTEHCSGESPTWL